MPHNRITSPNSDNQTQTIPTLKQHIRATSSFFEAYDRILQAERERECAERELSDALASLLPFLSEYIETAISPERRQLIIHELYWRFPQVSLTEIARIINVKGGVGQLSKVAGPLEDSPFSCPECGSVTTVRSRSQFADLSRDIRKFEHEKRWYHYHPLLCQECRQKHDVAQEPARRLHQERRNAREHALSTMPYAEYLKTPEWQSTRADALRRAGRACQLCNARNTELHVHHRSYERRGHEWNSDLIVLCAPCHEQFHFGGEK